MQNRPFTLACLVVLTIGMSCRAWPRKLGLRSPQRESGFSISIPRNQSTKNWPVLPKNCS
jgi:hypothetical protein